MMSVPKIDMMSQLTYQKLTCTVHSVYKASTELEPASWTSGSKDVASNQKETNKGTVFPSKQ